MVNQATSAWDSEEVSLLQCMWSAGHSVSGVRAVPTVAELVDALVQEYRGGAATESRST